MPTREEREAALTVVGKTSAERLVMAMYGHGLLDLNSPYKPAEEVPSIRQIAAVVRGFADHTHIVHMLSDVTRRGLNYGLMGGPPENELETILGRYFHAVADQLRDLAIEQEQRE